YFDLSLKIAAYLVEAYTTYANHLGQDIRFAIFDTHLYPIITMMEKHFGAFVIANHDRLRLTENISGTIPQYHYESARQHISIMVVPTQSYLNGADKVLANYPRISLY